MSVPESLKGFTLVELLVVMAIIALLLMIAAPRYSGSVQRGKEAALKETLATTRDALEQFYEDRGRYPYSLQDLVSSKYLRKLPYDPVVDRDDAWIIVPPERGEGVFDLHSSSRDKARDGTPHSQW
ncbi:MAG TPA: type II secretion system protein [Solimonas sp.]